MRIRRTLWVTLCWSLLWMAGLDAEAQQTIPDCSNVPLCFDHYERAKQASTAGSLDEALRLYGLAYEIQADPRLLYSIGRVLHKLSRNEEASSYYDRFLQSAVDDPEQKRKARDYLAEIKPPRPPSPPTPPLPSVEGPLTGVKEATPITTPSAIALREPTSEFHARPVHKKWWFWTIVGTAAAGLAGGIAGGVLTAKASSATLPTLPNPSFRPFD